MTNKDLQKVTKKDTKDVIFNALVEAKERIAALESSKLDPEKKAKIKKNEEVVKTAEKVMADESLTEMIHKLRTDGTVTLEAIAEKISDANKEYTTVVEASEIKKGELKELFDIEEVLFDLVTIVNAKEEIKVKYEEEYTIAKSEKDEYLAKVQAEANEEIANKKATIKALDEEDKQNRERKEKEWEYDFNRHQLKKNNELQDELEAENKVHNAKIEEEEKELAERESKVKDREIGVAERETKMDDLEKLVAEIPTKVNEAREEGHKKGIADTEKTTAIKSSYAKKEFESEKKVFENRIELLEADNKKKDETIDDLTEKLNKAYAEMREMATSAINASRPTIITSGEDKSKSIK